MQCTDPNVINYNFARTSTTKDNIPSWMNDELFETLQKPQEKIAVNGFYLNQKSEPICAECGSKLAQNEVAYCSACRQKFNKF